MTPRCGPQTGLTHSLPTQRQGGGIKEASPGESLSNIKKRLSLSVDFCYFQSIGLSELWLNVICRKAKNGSPCMLHYPRIKNAVRAAISR